MHILKDSGTYSFFNSLNIQDKLEVKNYTFDFDSRGRCFLKDADDFKMPERLYDVSSDLRRYIRTAFEHYDKNLGALLVGNKGQGKSITAKLLCKELNVPIVMFTKSIPISIDFVSFMNQIQQDHCVFIDEFEKLFPHSNTKNDDYHEQTTFLSYMDGVMTHSHKTMFLLTSNSSINDYMMNRPSRVRFVKLYNELDEKLFHMIVDDRLENKDFKKDLIDNVSFLNLNIDVLISIIDDINLFDVPFSSFAQFYNYVPDSYRYEVYSYVNGKKNFDGHYRTTRRIGNKDTYINGHHIKDMLKYSEEEIVYSVDCDSIDTEIEDDTREKFKERNGGKDYVIYSAKLAKYTDPAMGYDLSVLK